MVEVDRVYPFGLVVWCLIGDFLVAIKDYQQDGVESTRCIGAISYKLLRLLLILPIKSNTQVPVRGPNNIHIQISEFVIHTGFILVVVLNWRDDLVIRPNLHCELAVVVAHRLVKFIRKIP